MEGRSERKSARAQLQWPSTRTFYLRHLIFQSIKFPGFARPRPCKRQPRGKWFSTWRDSREKDTKSRTLFSLFPVRRTRTVIACAWDCVSLRTNTVIAFASFTSSFFRTRKRVQRIKNIGQ